MKRIEKRLKNNATKIVTFIIVFPIIFFFTLLFISNAKFSDFFTTGRVSNLEKRDPNISKDIIVDATLSKDEGGVKTLTENILKGIAMKRQDWRLIVLIPHDSSHDNYSRLKSFKNIKFIYPPAKYNFYFSWLEDVFDFLTIGLFQDKIKQLCYYDTICFDNKCDLFFDPLASIAPNDFPIPKVSLIHDLAYIDIPEAMVQCIIPVIKKNAPTIVKSSQKIITVSNFSQKRIIEEYKVDDNFVRAIHIRLANRIAFGHNEKFSNLVFKKYELTKNKYLIFSSSFWMHKNHKRLLEAFSKFLASHNSDIKLAIVGKFFAKNADCFQDALKKRNLQGKVVFTDFIPEEELNVLLSNALAFVHPSLYEGFGMPIIEAMAAGIPIICSNAGSLPEVAGDAALFFDPYNVDEMAAAIARITSDADLRKELIQKGYKQAAKFADTDAMIDEYIQVFEEVMENHRTSEISK